MKNVKTNLFISLLLLFIFLLFRTFFLVRAASNNDLENFSKKHSSELILYLFLLFWWLWRLIIFVQGWDKPTDNEHSFAIDGI